MDMLHRRNLAKVKATRKPIIRLEDGEWRMYSDVVYVSYERSLSAAHFVGRLNGRKADENYIAKMYFCG